MKFFGDSLGTPGRVHQSRPGGGWPAWLRAGYRRQFPRYPWKTSTRSVSRSKGQGNPDQLACRPKPGPRSRNTSGDTQKTSANSGSASPTEHYAKGTSDKVRTGSGAVEVTQIITQASAPSPTRKPRASCAPTWSRPATPWATWAQTVGNIVGMFGH